MSSFFTLCFSFCFDVLVLLKSSVMTIPAYPLPSMSTLPEMDWPNICRPGFTLRPDSFCNTWYQPLNNTREPTRKKWALLFFVFVFVILKWTFPNRSIAVIHEGWVNTPPSSPWGNDCVLFLGLKVLWNLHILHTFSMCFHYHALIRL